MVVAFLVRDSLSVADELARSSDELNEMWQPLLDPPVIQSVFAISREPNVSWNPLPSAVSQVTSMYVSVVADSAPVMTGHSAVGFPGTLPDTEWKDASDQ